MQQQLVVNPGDFYDDLRELIVDRWGRVFHDPEEKYAEARRILQGPDRPDRKMRELDELLNTHGVETFPPYPSDEEYLYLNTGESYEPTVMYSVPENKFFVASWGDVAEQHSAEQEDDYWESHLNDEVLAELERRIEDDEALSDAEREQALGALAYMESDRLRSMFRRALDAAGGEITVESDGSHFVYKFREGLNELYDRLVPRQRENARRGSKSAPSPAEAARWIREQAVDRDLSAGFARATTNDVAQALGISVESARRILSRAAREGLVTRHPDRVNLRGRGFVSGTSDQHHRVGYTLWEVYWEPEPQAGLSEHQVLEAVVAAGRKEGSGYGRARLADVREGLSDTREAQDALLLGLQRAGILTLMSIDNPMDITERDRAAALYIAGHPRHIVVPQQSHRIWENYQPNPSGLGGEDFLSALRTQLNIGDRRIIAHPPRNTGQLFVNFINLPSDVAPGGGAEAENNRMMFGIEGFGPGPNLPPPTGKVRVEQMVNAISREYRLRARSGTPEKIAGYLAEFINRVAAEVPPKFTHTKRTENAKRARRKVEFVVVGTADFYKDRYMKFGDESTGGRTLNTQADTESAARAAAEKWMAGQDPHGADARVWIEERYPDGGFRAVAAWKKQGLQWVPA